MQGAIVYVFHLWDSSYTFLLKINIKALCGFFLRNYFLGQ